jgi:adenosine 3'-phospho 5'-phosphosulfate transporter B3
VYCICAALEMLFTRDFRRKGSLRSYLLLSALMFGGMYFTNWALNYLNYATRILFKSSKVVPTMAIGHVMQVRTDT